MRLDGPYPMRGRPRVRVLELGDASSIGSAFSTVKQGTEDVVQTGTGFASQAYQDAYDFLKRQVNDAMTGNIADMFSTGGSFGTQQAQNTAQFISDQVDNTGQLVQQSANADLAVVTTAVDALVPYLVWFGLGIGGLFLLSRAMGDD